MTKTLAETLLFASVAVNAALLIFIAGVLRKGMNDMNVPAFRQFVGSLVRHSSRSPFMLIALNVPLLGAIPYLYCYGFGNRWIIAGLVLWLVGGVIAKIIKIPIYKRIATLEDGDADTLRTVRRKLNAGNLFQAILNSAAVISMVIGLFQ